MDLIFNWCSLFMLSLKITSKSSVVNTPSCFYSILAHAHQILSAIDIKDKKPEKKSRTSQVYLTMSEYRIHIAEQFVFEKCPVCFALNYGYRTDFYRTYFREYFL